MPAPFGNDPAKLDRYRAFWRRADAARPLVGFSLASWFPWGEFQACREWQGCNYLTPDMIQPAAFLDDHLRMLREGEWMDDDLIRGACPGQVALPWLPGMVGARIRILPSNAMGEELRLGWEDALQVRLCRENPWYLKYMEFAQALVQASAGRFPVSHSPELGPTDLHALLRDHTACVLDLTDQPERSAELLERLGEIFCAATRELWERLPRWHGGAFDAQYSLWAPGSIVRLQEDATAVYSPALYRRFVQPVDRRIARSFECAFVHLHSTSMFLLPAFLEIEEIRCFEINQDALGPAVREMLPHFRRVQDAGRPLLIRGALSADDLRLLQDSLECRGLFLNLMVQDQREVEPLRRVLGM